MHTRFFAVANVRFLGGFLQPGEESSKGITDWIEVDRWWIY